MEKQSDLLGVSAAARLLGASAGSVRGWADVGRLPTIRTTEGVRLFRRADLEAFKQIWKKRRK